MKRKIRLLLGLAAALLLTWTVAVGGGPIRLERVSVGHQEEDGLPHPSEELATAALEQFYWTSQTLTFKCNRVVSIPQHGERMPVRKYHGKHLRLAECEVLSCLYGPARAGDVFYALIPKWPNWIREKVESTVGIHLASFRPESTITWASTETIEAVRAAVGSAEVLEFRSPVHVFTGGKLSDVLPYGPDCARPYLVESPALADSVEAVRRQIRALVPIVLVRHATTGLDPWEARILDNDSLHVISRGERPEVTQAIPPGSTQRIRELIDELIATLPDGNIGRSRWPCDSFLWVGVFAREERRLYRIYHPLDDTRFPSGIEKLFKLLTLSGLLEHDLRVLDFLRADQAALREKAAAESSDEGKHDGD